MSRQQVLATLIEEHGWTSGVELGVYEGETLFYLLERFPSLRMVGVDQWERTPGPRQDRETGEASYAEKPMEEIAARVKARAAVDFKDRLTIIHGDSAQSSLWYKDGTFDFVFIDASHTTAAVLADIAAWRPKLRAGGALTGHDANWPSVRRALDEAAPGWMSLAANVWISR